MARPSAGKPVRMQILREPHVRPTEPETPEGSLCPGKAEVSVGTTEQTINFLKAAGLLSGFSNSQDIK